MSFCCHSEQRSDEESTISPPPGERHREGASQFNSRRLNSPSQSPDLTNKNACTTLCISGPPPNDATAPKITKCCRMLQKQENSSDGQPLVASSLDRIQPSPNFTITRKMSQNAPKCPTFCINSLSASPAPPTPAHFHQSPYRQRNGAPYPDVGPGSKSSLSVPRALCGESPLPR